MSQPPLADGPNVTVVDLQRQVDQLRAEMGDLAGQNLRLFEVIGTVEGRIPPAPSSAGPGVGPGFGFAENASDEQRQELTRWVDWLIAAYDLLANRSIKPCWRSHPGAVEELAALHQAWVEATSQGGTALATWHGAYLTGTLTRLESLYQISRCRPDRCEEPRPNPATTLPDQP